MTPDTPPRPRRTRAPRTKRSAQTYEAPATVLAPDGSRIKRMETWTRSEWRPLVQAQQTCNKRGVGVAIMCSGCGEPLLPIGVDAGGVTCVDCGCTTRRWMR